MAMAIKKQTPQAFPKKRAPKRADYLDFIRKLPCAVTGQHGVEAAHVSFASPLHGHFGRAKGTKAPDIFAVPLCTVEHRRQHNMNEREYWAEWAMSPHLLALALWAIYSMYEEQEATERATARIYGGIAKAAGAELPW